MDLKRRDAIIRLCVQYKLGSPALECILYYDDQWRALRHEIRWYMFKKYTIPHIMPFSGKLWDDDNPPFENLPSSNVEDRKDKCIASKKICDNFPNISLERFHPMLCLVVQDHVLWKENFAVNDSKCRIPNKSDILCRIAVYDPHKHIQNISIDAGFGYWTTNKSCQFQYTEETSEWVCDTPLLSTHVSCPRYYLDIQADTFQDLQCRLVYGAIRYRKRLLHTSHFYGVSL